MSTVADRAEIDEEYKWDLESVYSSVEEWEEAFEAVTARIEDLRNQEGHLDEGGERLLEILELRDAVMRRVSTISAYARMRFHEDTRNDDFQALTARARSLQSDANSAASFIEPEIQMLTHGRIDAMIGDTPDLDTYRHYLEDVLRMKPHTRSTEVENLLADLGEVLGSGGEVYNRLLNADMTFPSVDRPDGSTVEITQSNFTTLLKSSDRGFRESVHEAFYGELESVRNAVASSLSNSVKTHVKLAEARGYDTARDAALDGPNIPVQVYDTLVDTVDGRLDTLHRHLDLKAAVLDVDPLRMWDVYMPLTESESPSVPYEDATDHIVGAVEPLGETYRDRVAEGIDSRWIDVYENRGKQSGAYSGGTYDTQPFILMNYQGDISSMFTLAHELGHSLHSEYASEHQPYVYSGFDIFTAEVASTVNETLLTYHLLETVSDDVFRRHVLSEFLERFRSTLFRQTMFAEFEHRIHSLAEGDEPLTAGRLDGLYGDYKSAFYAPADVDDHIRREWMRIPHFHYNYYVYQYATGISAAVAIVADILEDGQSGADRYIEFLSRGSHGYPLELLREAGVDMASSDPVERAIDVYDEHLDEIEALI